MPRSVCVCRFRCRPPAGILARPPPNHLFLSLPIHPTVFWIISLDLGFLS